MSRLIEAVYAWATAALQDVTVLDSATVRLDQQGQPVAWRLLPMGQFRLTRDGEEFSGEMTADIAQTIMAQAKAKAIPVPLDLHHNLKALADTLGMEEGDLAKVLPQGHLTIGYGTLANHANGIWLDAVQWTDAGKKLVAAGLFRYFSPVIRGLKDGRYRITSVALTNNPALQGLDALAASDGEPPNPGAALTLKDLQGHAAKRKGTQPMNEKIRQVVCAALATDALALDDAGNPTAETVARIDAATAEIPKLRLLAGTAAKVRDALALAGDADESAIMAGLEGLKAKGQAHDALKARVDALALEAETTKREKVIERGMTEGKLTKAMVDGWASKQDALALEAFLQHAPVVVVQGRIANPANLAPVTDAVAMSDAEKTVFRTAGLTDTDIAALEADRKAAKKA
jgi:phage I-like protein